MNNPTRIGQEAPDLKTPSSPSRITPTRALDDDAEHHGGLCCGEICCRPVGIDN